MKFVAPVLMCFMAFSTTHAAGPDDFNAEELYQFLIAGDPSLVGAQDFFDAVGSGRSIPAERGLQGWKIFGAWVEHGNEFANDLGEVYKAQFGDQALFAIDPSGVLLKEFRKNHLHRPTPRDRPVRDEEARRKAFQETSQKHGFRPGESLEQFGRRVQEERFEIQKKVARLEARLATLSPEHPRRTSLEGMKNRLLDRLPVPPELVMSEYLDLVEEYARLETKQMSSKRKYTEWLDLWIHKLEKLRDTNAGLGWTQAWKENKRYKKLKRLKEVVFRNQKNGVQVSVSFADLLKADWSVRSGRFSETYGVVLKRRKTLTSPIRAPWNWFLNKLRGKDKRRDPWGFDLRIPSDEFHDDIAIRLEDGREFSVKGWDASRLHQAMADVLPRSSPDSHIEDASRTFLRESGLRDNGYVEIASELEDIRDRVSNLERLTAKREAVDLAPFVHGELKKLIERRKASNQNEGLARVLERRGQLPARGSAINGLEFSGYRLSPYYWQARDAIAEKKGRMSWVDYSAKSNVFRDTLTRMRRYAKRQAYQFSRRPIIFTLMLAGELAMVDLAQAGARVGIDRSDWLKADRELLADEFHPKFDSRFFEYWKTDDVVSGVGHFLWWPIDSATGWGRFFDYNKMSRYENWRDASPSGAFDKTANWTGDSRTFAVKNHSAGSLDKAAGQVFWRIEPVVAESGHALPTVFYQPSDARELYKRWEAPAEHRPDYWLRSELPHYTSTGAEIFVPSAPGNLPDEVVVRNHKTHEVITGSFGVEYGPQAGGVILKPISNSPQLKKENGSFLVDVDVGFRTGVPPVQTVDDATALVDSKKIGPYAETLRGFGFTNAADGIKGLGSRAKVTMRDVETVLRDTALYTYTPVGWSDAIDKSVLLNENYKARDILEALTAFLRKDGCAYYQCNAAYWMMDAAYLDLREKPSQFFRPQLAWGVDAGAAQITGANSHVVLLANIQGGGEFAAHYDATPWKMDPDTVRPKSKQPTKSEEQVVSEIVREKMEAVIREANKPRNYPLVAVTPTPDKVRGGEVHVLNPDEINDAPRGARTKAAVQQEGLDARDFEKTAEHLEELWDSLMSQSAVRAQPSKMIKNTPIHSVGTAKNSLVEWLMGKQSHEWALQALGADATSGLASRLESMRARDLEQLRKWSLIRPGAKQKWSHLADAAIRARIEGLYDELVFAARHFERARGFAVAPCLKAAVQAAVKGAVNNGLSGE